MNRFRVFVVAGVGHDERVGFGCASFYLLSRDAAFAATASVIVPIEITVQSNVVDLVF